jgi:hypothetical protein
LRSDLLVFLLDGRHSGHFTRVLLSQLHVAGLNLRLLSFVFLQPSLELLNLFPRFDILL